VNYKLDSLHKLNGQDKTITINKLSIFDKNFNELNFKYLFPSNYESKYVGIEDIRLFIFNNDIYFIGSFYNSDNDKIQIVSNKYDIETDYEPIIITPTFKTNFNWEKNWVFFNNNNELNIIYKWYPIYICSINYETKELNLLRYITDLPIIFKEFRGSTNGLEYDNKIWFIVHQSRKVTEGVTNYMHNFVVFNKNMNLLGYSKEFNFENSVVEFCLGMTLYNNNFIITYSALDCSSKIVVFSPEYINSLIDYF
jgi:hypothetical protein